MSATLRIRVVMISPDIHHRFYLTTLFNASPRHVILNTATTATAVLDWSSVITPDIVLVDTDLPDLPCTRLIRFLHARWSTATFLLLAERHENLAGIETSSGCAPHVILKTASKTEVFAAIDNALIASALPSHPLARISPPRPPFDH